MPYTTSLPKPLMPIGDYPILEILLRQLSQQGFRRVTLAVGHLASLIQAYFKEGQDFGLEITYAMESRPLGTAGPLRRLPRFDRSVLVLNGDLLTNLEFGKVVRFHYENDSFATVSMKRRTETVSLGVIETDQTGEIRQFREKPSMDYLVSMGIYVFSPAVRDYIPLGEKFDFPELVQRLLSQGKKVMGYETDSYWMDIGRPDDYERANREFPEMEPLILGNHVETATVGTRI